MVLRVRESLSDFLIGKDIVVATTQEIEDWKEVPQAFITYILYRENFEPFLPKRAIKDRAWCNGLTQCVCPPFIAPEIFYWKWGTKARVKRYRGFTFSPMRKEAAWRIWSCIQNGCPFVLNFLD